MKTYCVSCKNNTENKHSRTKHSNTKSKQKRLMLLSNCAVCGK